jgi:phage-related protein
MGGQYECDANVCFIGFGGILLIIWHMCHILNIERKLKITMDKFEVEFYTKANGEKPAKDFILGLDVKMRAKVLGIINVLEEKGNQLREPYSKHLDDGIFEIPGKVGTDIARVLYFFYYGKKIVMTNGFIKKTQETPKTGNKTGKIISQRLLGKGDR